MRERIEIECPKCRRRFVTAYKIGHWEECPHCRKMYYVSHDEVVRKAMLPFYMRPSEGGKK